MYLRLLLRTAFCSTAAGAQAVAPRPDAPPVFPAPAYTPAGAGAPRVGQPGAQVTATPVPLSPNTRVLPPTAEPGLWAADELRAVKQPSSAAPDVEEPRAARKKSPDLPAPTIDELLATTPTPGTPLAEGCRQRLLRASRSAGTEEARRNLPQSARDCVNARLILHCVASRSKDVKVRARNTPRIDGRDFLAEYAAEVDAVAFWRLRICKDGSLIPPFEVIVSEIIGMYERQSRGGQ